MQPTIGLISCSSETMDTADASVTVVQLPPAFVGEQAVYGPHYRGGLAPPPEWWANFAHPLAPWPPAPLQCTPAPAMQHQCYWPHPPPPPPQQFTPQPPMQGQFCWPPPPQQFFVMNCFAVSPGLSYQPVPWQPPVPPQFQIQVPCFQAPPAPAPVTAFINAPPPSAPVPAFMHPPPPPAAAPKLPGPILDSPAMAPPKPPRPSWADISEVPVPASPCHPEQSQEEPSSSSAPQSLPHLLGNRPKASKSKKGRKRT